MNIYNLPLISMPGGSEWFLIIIAILILFGGRKIPELMGGIGKGIKEFKKATSEENEPQKKSEEAKKED